MTVALLAVYVGLLAHPIDLTISDLGRHLKNGELFFSAVLSPTLISTPSLIPIIRSSIIIGAAPRSLPGVVFRRRLFFNIGER